MIFGFSCNRYSDKLVSTSGKLFGSKLDNLTISFAVSIVTLPNIIPLNTWKSLNKSGVIEFSL